MARIELFSPLSNRPIVSHHLCTTLLLSERVGSSLLVVCFWTTRGPFGWRSISVPVTQSSQGQSEVKAPSSRDFPLTFTTPPNTHSAEKESG